jgi:peptidyl-prolyl cis-trans isomerase B (cyclophilin B)
LAATKNQNEALTGEKLQLQQQLQQTQAELEGLRKATGDASTVEQEMTALRAKAGEVDGLNQKLATQQKQLEKAKDFEKKLNDVGKDAEKLAFLTQKMKGIKATIVTNLGEIEVAFYADLAPIHCFNFIAHAESGYFNKTQFHRVIPGFMIQGGDPNSRDMNFADDGTGSPIVAIPHEFNPKPHKRGILSMARPGDPRVGAGSQFFIMHADAPQLDNQYTVFGEVTKGMEVVDKIANAQRDFRDHPKEPVWIEAVKVTR